MRASASNIGEPRLSKEERREAIAELVLEQRSASAAALAEMFDVSLVTIHRDLDELAEEGLLRRFHGGASAIRNSLFEPDITYRMRLATQAKFEIAHAALKLVQADSSLLLDDSSTALTLAKILHTRGRLTVATSFMEVQQILSRHESIHLVGLGGDYLPQQHSFGGPGFLAGLKDLRVNVLFASTSAVDRDGAYHQEPDVVVNKRAMMAVAEKRYLLIDRTKLRQNAFHRISDLAAWDALVVDSLADEETVQQLEAAGATVIVAAALTNENTVSS